MWPRFVCQYAFEKKTFGFEVDQATCGVLLIIRFLIQLVPCSLEEASFSHNNKIN